MLYNLLAKPLLFSLGAESAHDTVFKLAKVLNATPISRSAAGAVLSSSDSVLGQRILDLDFPNPVGLAAGFDKNGHLAKLFESIGFGFIEVGSVTAQPSAGNAKPRSFRLPKDQALINRMGLNNDGADVITKRLKALKLRIPLGINIAKTHSSEIQGPAAITDYVESFQKVEPLAAYITVNISCPNTADGRTFEDKAGLTELLDAINEVRSKNGPPVLVKFSVDADQATLSSLVELSLNKGMNGFVATNTSNSRAGLLTEGDTVEHIGRGGLSGRPIHKRSNAVVAAIRQAAGSDVPVIGVGGVESAETAIAKLAAGADLVQVYTGMVYQGPGLAGQINKVIASSIRKRGLSGIGEFIQLVREEQNTAVLSS